MQLNRTLAKQTPLIFTQFVCARAAISARLAFCMALANSSSITSRHAVLAGVRGAGPEAAEEGEGIAASVDAKDVDASPGGGTVSDAAAAAASGAGEAALELAGKRMYMPAASTISRRRARGSDTCGRVQVHSCEAAERVGSTRSSFTLLVI